MAKETVYPIRFVVEGAGALPLDMLRYDSCWPESQADVGKAAEVHTLRRVTLAGYSLNKPTRDTATGLVRMAPFRAAPKCGVTPERWASFGWRVIEVQER